MNPLITLDGVSRTYDGGGAPALDRVDLQIEAGQITAVMGPSGGGKSTLLNLIGGLDRPSAGAVTVDGIRVDRLGEAGSARFRRSRVGFIFQFFHLLDDLSVRDNVAIPATLAGVRRAVATGRADELLAQLGLAAVADRVPATLSGGQRQRVAIARAIVNRPAVLLADEPTGALDSHTGDEVLAMLADLNRLGQTIVLVTHDARLAGRTAHRIVTLIDGRITADTAATRAA